MKQKKEANPLVWGAWGGIVCAVIALGVQLAGETLPQTIWQAGMGGFFWLWVVANVKNWLAARPIR